MLARPGTYFVTCPQLCTRCVSVGLPFARDQERGEGETGMKGNARGTSLNIPWLCHEEGPLRRIPQPCG